jgi:hypothetical protein
MSDQEVSYTLSLKDLLTGKIKDADGAINHMEGSLGHAAESAKEFGKELIGAIGISFALFKGFEFVHEAKESWEELEFATSQVEAGLESTRGVAGMTFEALKQGAADAAHNMKFTQAQVMGMQSILLTFPGVTKKTWGDASQAIFDMSTRLKQDLNSTAIQVGKALQDPIRGVTALHRVGVNFSESQTEMIKKLVETGQTAKAQALILRELNSEFAGSAAAAAAADVSFRYEKTMEELKVTIGEVADKLAGVFMPVLETVVDGIKGAIEWMIKNRDILMDFAVGIGVAAGAWGIYTLAVEGSTIATGFLTAATAAWNAVLSISPLGWFLIALGAVTTAVMYCYQHFGKFRAVLFGVWETIKEFGRIVGDIFMGLWHVIHGVFTFSPGEVKDGMMQQIDAISNAGERLGGAFKKGFDAGMADFNKDQAEKNAPHTIAKQGKEGAAGVEGKPAKPMTPKGSKSVTHPDPYRQPGARVQSANHQHHRRRREGEGACRAGPFIVR